MSDYSNAVQALQLAKFDQQEAAYLEACSSSDEPVSAAAAEDMALQYAFRARLHDDLAALATNADTARAHHSKASECRAARALYVDSSHLQALSELTQS